MSGLFYFRFTSVKKKMAQDFLANHNTMKLITNKIIFTTELKLFKKPTRLWWYNFMGSMDNMCQGKAPYYAP